MTLSIYRTDQRLEDPSAALVKLETMANDWGVCGKNHLLDLCTDVKRRSRHLTYSWKIVRRNGKRMPIVRVGLRAKWRQPTTEYGLQLHSFIAEALSMIGPDAQLTWDVFEEINGDSAQIQLKRSGRRESLVIEELQTAGLNEAVARAVIEWMGSTTANQHFGAAPNIRILANNGVFVPP